MKKVLLVKNIAREGPGLVELALAKRKVTCETIEMRDGIKLPRPAEYAAVFVFGGPDSANKKKPSC